MSPRSATVGPSEDDASASAESGVKKRIRRRRGRRRAIPLETILKRTLISIAGILLLASGCGASFPEPTQKLADAEAAHRSARELGADKKTDAQLNLKLAQEEIDAAKAQIKAGDNRRADFILLRAKADAELALALAREHDAKNDTVKAIDTSNAAQNAKTNGAQ
jgi:hypothetical protein